MSRSQEVCYLHVVVIRPVLSEKLSNPDIHTPIHHMQNTIEHGNDVYMYYIKVHL